MLLFQTDTTGVGYKIGYQIGSWLPFLVLATIFIWLLLKAFKRSKDQ